MSFHLHSRLPDFYSLLAVPHDATLPQIKSAYHRILLTSHPDKLPARHPDGPSSIDIPLIKDAYNTLSHPERRAAYDAATRLGSSHNTSPRPAQLVSLQDFEQQGDSQEGPWTYSCRCGGWYRISTSLMEEGKHIVPCTNCSEVIWVGYEEITVEQDSTSIN